MSQEIKWISIKNLSLWNENPRDPIGSDVQNDDIVLKAINSGDKKWRIEKLLEEMGDHYDCSELPTVVQEGDKYIVYDGNRRIIAIKIIQNEDLKRVYLKKINNINLDNFLNLEKIPCNVCDKNTALDNIERKHSTSGSWNQLERDYFVWRHRGKKPSGFLIINEETKIIEKNEKLNQGFVKNEILTDSNLKDIGIEIDYDTQKVHSRYSMENFNIILDAIVHAIETEKISTRRNRGKLKQPLCENEDLKRIIESEDTKSKEGHTPANTPIDSSTLSKRGIKPLSDKTTPPTKPDNKLFGRNLCLKPGKVNDLYMAINKIYKNNKNDITILPVVGMSLRLLIEIAARVQFEEDNNKKIAKEDISIYNDFLKNAKKI